MYDDVLIHHRTRMNRAGFLGGLSGLVSPRIHCGAEACGARRGKARVMPAVAGVSGRIGRVFARWCGHFRLHWSLRGTRRAAWLFLSGSLVGCDGLVPEVGEGAVRAGDVARVVESELGRSHVPRTGHRILKVETERPYTGLRPVAAAPKSRLPEQFLGEDGISLPLDRALSPAEMSQHITAATGLPVRFAGRPLPTPPGAGGVRFTARSGRVLGGEGRWSGPLPALLDEWTQEHGYEWRYDGAKRVIEVVRGLSAVFQLHALGGSQSYQVASSTAGGGSKAGETLTADFSEQRLDTKYEYDPWPEIEKTVKALMSEGSTAEVSPAQASVIVVGLPGDVARVRGYLRHVNRSVLRPIVVTVRIFTVARDRGADFETDFNIALRTIAGSSLDFVLEGGRDAPSVAIVRPGYARVGNSLDATLRALRSLGTVSRVLTAGVPALNGAPAQYYEMDRHTYLAEVSTTVDDGDVSTELRPGAISSGFAMSYVGRITGPGEILLRIFASLQDPPRFDSFGSAGNQIQLPSFRSRGISVTQAVREGETLVLSGFTDRRVTTEQQGFVKAGNPFAGATVHGEARIDQVLLVTIRIGEPAGVSEVSEVLL